MKMNTKTGMKWNGISEFYSNRKHKWLNRSAYNILISAKTRANYQIQNPRKNLMKSKLQPDARSGFWFKNYTQPHY